MQGRMEGDTSPPGMEEENDWFFLGRLLFRKAWLLSYQSLPDSWRASCCAWPSTGGNLRLYHRKWRPHQPTSSEISLGNSTAPCASLCMCWWRHCLQTSFETFWLFDFIFFLSKSTLPKTLEKGWEKGKTKCNRHFYIIIELFRWEWESWKFSDDWKDFNIFGKLLAEVEFWILAGIPQELLPALLQVR